MPCVPSLYVPKCPNAEACQLLIFMWQRDNKRANVTKACQSRPKFLTWRTTCQTRVNFSTWRANVSKVGLIFQLRLANGVPVLWLFFKKKYLSIFEFLNLVVKTLSTLNLSRSFQWSTWDQRNKCSNSVKWTWIIFLFT